MMTVRVQTERGKRDRPPRSVRKKLTFDLDAGKHRQFKTWCAAQGVTMGEWLAARIDEVV